MDSFSVAALTVLLTLVGVGIFAHFLTRFETAIADGFSRASQSARWFSIWLIAFPIYAIGSTLLRSHTTWYTDQVDSLVMAFLWSAIPYYLENAIKYSQAKQMGAITVLIEHVREELGHSRQRDEATELRDDATALRDRAMFELVQRAVHIMEKLSPKLEESNDNTK